MTQIKNINTDRISIPSACNQKCSYHMFRIYMWRKINLKMVCPQRYHVYIGQNLLKEIFKLITTSLLNNRVKKNKSRVQQKDKCKIKMPVTTYCQFAILQCSFIRYNQNGV